MSAEVLIFPLERVDYSKKMPEGHMGELIELRKLPEDDRIVTLEKIEFLQCKCGSTDFLVTGNFVGENSILQCTMCAEYKTTYMEPD